MKTAVITFGRFNPITVGHEMLVNKVKGVAASVSGTPLVFLSHSQDNNRNPLNYLVKFNLAQIAFGKCVVMSPLNNIIEIVKSLDADYDNIVFVGDKPRSEEFKVLLDRYNGVEYNFDTIETVSAGDRDPDADDISGMSATKMRGYALNNDLENFTLGLPLPLKIISKNVMENVRKGMTNE